MSKGSRARRATRAAAAMLAWAASRVAYGFMVLAQPALAKLGLAKLGLAAWSSVAALVLAGGAATGYYLLHRHDAAQRSVVLLRRQPGGALRASTVRVGGARGEDQALLAHAEGLPVAGSQPLPGVSQALRDAGPEPAGASSPASRPDSTSAPAAAGPASGEDSPYLQALALSTMVRIDDRPDRALGWPLVSYCRAGVRALQCHHNDVWLRNASPLDIRGLRVCLPRAARAYYTLAGAGADACLHADLGASADLHLDLREAQPAQPGYPPFGRLRLRLSLPAWHKGRSLATLRLPVARPQTFYPLPRARESDRRHALVVQTRRVDLLTQLVVFTYHGSAGSSAVVRALDLKDPTRSLRLIDRVREPWAFRHDHVAQCSTQAAPGPGREHVLHSGVSCAVLLSTSRLLHASWLASHRDPASSPAGQRQGPGAGASGAQAGALPGAMPQTRYRMGNLSAEFNLRSGGQPYATVWRGLRIHVDHLVAVGGDFTRFGLLGVFGLPAPHLLVIGRAAMGAPAGGLLLLPGDQVDAISMSPNQRDLYIGGVFHPLALDPAGRRRSSLAVYHQGHWVFWTRSQGPSGRVRALACTSTRMLVGGDFTAVAGEPSYGFAQFVPAGADQRAIADALWQPSGEQLQQLRQGHPGQTAPGRVYSLLAQSNGNFELGGSFGLNVLGRRPTELARAPSTRFANVLLWNHATRQWRGLGMLLGGPRDAFDQNHVDALAEFRNRLYAGGDFVYAGVVSPTVGLRDFIPVDGWGSYGSAGGGSWRRVIPSLEVRSEVHAFARTAGGLFAGGQMVNLEGERRVLLRLDTAGNLSGQGAPLAVDPLLQPGGTPADIRALAVIGNTLFLGGDFNRLSNGAQASDLAVFGGTHAQVFSSGGRALGVNATVRALRAIWVLSARPVG